MINQPNNIFLIGPMASGKTTIGRKLAKKTSKKFYDSDKEITKSTGAEIPLIFEIEGDSGFRKRETKIISKLVLLKNIGEAFLTADYSQEDLLSVLRVS